jgi:hypothetical protein
LEERLETLYDAELLFHILLFAYKGIVQNILGSGAAIFEHPTFQALRSILEKEGIDMMRGETLEEVLNNYSKMLKNSGLVQEALFEKIEPDKYLLKVDKCIYAKRLHKCLKPLLKGQTCRYALIAVPILEKFTGKKVKLASSDFTPEGTRTIIECEENNA